MPKSSLHPRVQRQSVTKDDAPITHDDGPLTIGDVIASLHTSRPGCIACIVRNAGIARIACNGCNTCNDEETSNDGTAYSALCILATPVRHFTTDLCHFRTSSQTGAPAGTGTPAH